MKNRLRILLQKLFAYSGREKQRILMLIPLLLLIGVLFLWQGKPRFDEHLTQYGEPVSGSRASVEQQKSPTKLDSLFCFDPNAVSLSDLIALGFSKKQAEGILRYREAGAVFRNPDDFARCYTVSEERFHVLRPYIVIPVASSQTKNPVVRHRRVESVAKLPVQPDSLFRFDPNTLSLEGFISLGFSKKQAEGILRYREAGAVFRKPADFARCYTVSEERFMQLEPYIQLDTADIRPPSVRTTVPKSDTKEEPIELNEADSATLVVLRGIGPLTAGRIIRYRERLGGFADAEQLQEVQGMTLQNYQQILQQIWVDCSKIQKIDINFALPSQIREHPYLPERVLNRLLKYRQLKGGWRSIGELTEQDILSQEQAVRLSPYLDFKEK